MLEYANIRFRLLCATPTTVPSTIVATAIAAMTFAQPGPAGDASRNGSKLERNTRANAANAAAFTPVDMKPVTTAGAPSYASGVHMWNGTAEILNAKPTSSRPSATTSSGLSLIDWAATYVPTRSRRVLPVSPYVNAMPYRKNALENAPSRKYLSAASAARGSCRLIPVRTYTASDRI